MTVTDKAWQSYIKKLSAINRKAAKIMQDWISVNGLDYPEELISYAYGIVGKYGEAAGALACEMYDTLARAQGKILPDAVPAEPATYSEVARAVIGTKKERPGQVPDTVARLVKQTAADTTLQNAKRDGAQFAWIPHGDTCSFCITLASRGWQYMSKNALKNGHAEHIHANCDCEYGVRFDGKSNVAGYDPDKYLEQYNNAEGTKPQDKINSMRREQYAADPEKYRAQKRAAYERRKELLNTKDNDIVDNNKDSIFLQFSSHNFHNTTDERYERVKHVPPIDGYDDVFIHGDAWGVSTENSDGKQFNISGADFIDILKRTKFDNKAIRLCACNTGSIDNGFASYVAKEMNMDIMAPTTDVWITIPDPKTDISEMLLYADNGKGKPDRSKPGRWRIFSPDGKIREV